MIAVTLAATVAVLFETEHRRREIGLFLWPKGIAAIWSGLVVRGLMPEIKNLETVVLIVSIGLIGIASN